jgi:hypothetical protein
MDYIRKIHICQLRSLSAQHKTNYYFNNKNIYHLKK